MEEGLHKLWQGVTPAIYRHIGMPVFILQVKCLLMWLSSLFEDLSVPFMLLVLL